MKKPPEIIPANQHLKINFYIFIAFYILLLIFIEPIIDYFLSLDVNNSNVLYINELNQKKKFLSLMSYGLLGLLPMLLLAWFGYRILSSAKLPPARMELPFAVPLQKGRNAKIIGLFIISLALLFTAQNIAYMTKQLLNF